jgi:hypothetical protein
VMMCSRIQEDLVAQWTEGEFNALSFAESVVGDSRVDTSNEGHEVAPQHDCDQESHCLEG